MDKVHEELDEVMQEVNQDPRDEEKVEEELGDLLFATVNLVRHLGKDPEMALTRANNKFIKRFQGVEKIVADKDSTLQAHSLDELESFWQQVKKKENR